MSLDQDIKWVKVEGTRAGRMSQVLVGRRILPDWLGGGAQVSKIRLGGDLRKNLSSLLDAAKSEKLNLPIASLRTALSCALGNVISIDRDLGLAPLPGGGHPCAIETYSQQDDVREVIAKTIREWVMNDVEPWAARNGMGAIVSQLAKSVGAESIDVTASSLVSYAGDGRPNFPLIARSIGERLAGEELFEGMGPCELVASPERGSNSVELMTRPKRAMTRHEHHFSMVARVSVVTVPYSDDLFLSVSAVKRTWADKPPTIAFAKSSSVDGYVMAVGRPVSRVRVVRTRDGKETRWEFGDEYSVLQRESENRLPANFAQAIQQREFSEETGWWAGFPELPSLYRSIAPRTVFEIDELDLLSTVCGFLSDVVDKNPIPVEDVKPPKIVAKTLQEMLRLSDFGIAGAAFQGDDEEGEGAADEEGGDLRAQKLEAYRDQNICALKAVHGGMMPVVWMFGGTQDEQDLTRGTLDVLFGSEVTFIPEALPEGTHGLRDQLGSPKARERERFEERVKSWAVVTQQVREHSGDKPIVALICAPDRIGRKPEDVVNYFAGIHAMSLIGANVHHVLPIERPDDPRSRQNFLHRVQSAILDVMIAHAGVATGVKEFVSSIFPGAAVPEAIYGIQAFRSRAQTWTGQEGVNMVLFSRLIVDSGRTEVRLGFRGAAGDELTDWMPLAMGATWVGSQRRLGAGDANWLKNAFSPLTSKVIDEISQQHPHAVVLIDWDKVASLWKGISDQDLGKAGPPRLGESRLSSLAGLSFVRLRRGYNTMSLRTIVKAAFSGVRLTDGQLEEFADIRTDSYATTLTRIVRLAGGDTGEARRFGHFIASMKYAKTVQILRGQSCYRSMTRMKQKAPGMDEYEPSTLDPAAIDAAIPAAMDITVMSSPQGVDPSALAILVTGLRIGYLHYNDWTSSPMPLFFYRKINDYVIRYPEGAGDMDDIEVPEGVDMEAETNPTIYQALVAEEAAGKSLHIDAAEASPAPIAAEPAPSMPPSPEGASAPAPAASHNEAASVPEPDDASDVPEEDAGPEGVLAAAKRTKVPILVEYGTDLEQKSLMVQMFRGKVEVTVQFPAWVSGKGRDFVECGAPPNKHRIRQSWGKLRKFGYLGSDTGRMPTEGEFTRWLSWILQKPQMGPIVGLATSNLGGCNFRDLVRVVEDRYNPSVPESEKVNPFFITPHGIELMVNWAQDHRDDELLAWLVIFVATLPSGNISALMRNLNSVPGPRTESALRYYIASADAIREALLQKSDPLKISIVMVPNADDEEDEEDVEGIVKMSSEKLFPAVHKSVAKIVGILRGVDPDGVGFSTALGKARADLASLESGIQSDLESLKNALDELEREHAQQEDERRQEAELAESKHREEAERAAQLERERAAVAEKLRETSSRQKAACERMRLLGEHVDLKGIDVVEIHESGIESALHELSLIEAAIGELESSLADLDSLNKMPAPMGLVERRNRAKKEEELTNDAIFCEESLKALVEKSSCFAKSGDVAAQPAGAKSQVAGEAAAGKEPATPAPPAVESPPESQARHQAATPADVPGVPRAPEVSAGKQQAEAPATQKTDAAAGSAAPDSVATEAIPDEVSESEDLDDASIPRFVEPARTLRLLAGKGLFGLAEVHVDALGVVADESGNRELQANHVILAAVVKVLDGLSSGAGFSSSLDAGLAGLLESGSKIPSGEAAEPVFMGLGIATASIGHLLFDVQKSQWAVSSTIAGMLSGQEALHRLAQQIENAKHRSLMLSRDMFVRSRVGDKAAIQMELAAFQKRAEGWKRGTEINSVFNHRGFKKVHEAMFSNSCGIGRCLSLIEHGDAARLAETYREAKKLFEKPSKTLEDLFKRVGERSGPEGLYRNLAMENIHTTERFIEDYLDLVSRHGQKGGELSRDIQDFLGMLHRNLTLAIEEVKKLPVENDLEGVYQDAAIFAFESVLGLYEGREATPGIPSDKQKLLVQLPLGKDLLPVVRPTESGIPALCTPEDVFDRVEQFAEEGLTTGNPEAPTDIEKALATALKEHIADKRFMPAFLIHRQQDHPHTAKGPTLETLHAQECSNFEAEVQEARHRVLNARTLDALPDYKAAEGMQRMLDELLRICQGEHRIGDPELESIAYPDFPQARAALANHVIDPLKASLSIARRNLEVALDDEEAQEKLAKSDLARVREMLAANSAASLRAASDALRLLRESGTLPSLVMSGESCAVEYDGYVAKLRKSLKRNQGFLEELRKTLDAEPGKDDPDWLAGLDADRRAEAKELIDAWCAFHKARNHADAEFLKRLTRAMGMGVATTPVYRLEHGRENRARFSLQPNPFLFQTSDDDPTFIPPVLGSWASTNQIIGIFGSPQEGDIRQVTQEIAGSPILVFARTHLSMEKRAQVTGGSPALIVDDDLIAYMAVHAGDRLQNMIRVAVLTFPTNPYDDYGAKPVPTEMFFGRKDELERLRNVKGLAVLYGGRRLGKSSLLNQIEWESRNNAGSLTAYISMETIENSDPVLWAWQHVCRTLELRKAISPITNTSPKVSAIIEHIRKELIESETIRSVYLLIDEANDLMGSELRLKRTEVGFIRGLIQLQDDIKHKVHLRMVIAGLHNVARMASDENSVFGKAETIALQPFSSTDYQRGIRLITKPLSALGYEFSRKDQDLTMRILAVCNFYPAFVQLYCKRLVERLQNKRQYRRPPVLIEASDLDAVEKDHSLLGMLREKFKLNLHLDKRYNAIALVLADRYYSESDKGQPAGLDVKDIRELCELWFTKHFENVGHGVYEALLDEMVKLNVLDRVGARYVLRTSQVAMMLGGREQIQPLMDELREQPPETSRSRGDRRVAMVRNLSHIVFPMPVSWIRNSMDATDGELIILAGNSKSGIQDLVSLDREEWQLLDEALLSVPGNGPQFLLEQVNKYRRAGGTGVPKFLCVRPRAWNVQQIPEYVAVANKAAKIGPTGIRIILLAPADVALEIAEDLDRRSAAGSQVDVVPGWRVVPIPPWSDDAIYYHVTENNRVAENIELIKAIRSATCGFSLPILSVCSDRLTVESLPQALKAASESLGGNLGAFYDNLGIPKALISSRGSDIKEFLVTINNASRDREHRGDIIEMMNHFGISQALFDYLYWMGLVQEGPGNSWTLPKPYAELLAQCPTA